MLLPPSPLLQRYPPSTTAHDEVIDQPETDHLPSRGHAAGKGQILGAGRRIATGVGVKEDKAGGVSQQTLFEDGPRLDRRPVEGTAEDLGVLEQPVAGVEKEGAHHLLALETVAQRQKGGHGFGVGEQIPLGKLGAGDPAGKLDRGQ